jgi:ribosomal protein S18 acetylase RimI-like enzyme
MANTASVTIRQATPEDLDALLPLVSAYRVFYEQQPDPQGERTFVESHLRSGTSVVYIAQIDGEPAGFMQLFKAYSTVHLCPSWILEDLFVDPKFRSSGIGGALLARALQHVRAGGAGSMFLETAHDNVTAQALYEKAGWVREGRFIKYNAPLA